MRRGASTGSAALPPSLTKVKLEAVLYTAVVDVRWMCLMYLLVTDEKENHVSSGRASNYFTAMIPCSDG